MGEMMKDQVILGKNDQLAIAIPLFRYLENEKVDSLGDYTIALISSGPLAYIVDLGDGDSLAIVNAEMVEKQCEFLGEL